MIKPILKLVIILSILFGLSSCKEGSDEMQLSTDYKKQNPIEVKYAQGFSVDTITGGLQRISITDLSISKEVATYVLVPKGSDYHPKDYEEVVYTPIDNIGELSSSYIGFLEALSRINNVVVIENHTFIYNEKLGKRHAEGLVTEVGSNGQINLEKLVINSPEVVFTSVFNGGLSDELKKAKDAGIVSVQCSEWQEHHPLARAEWIKVFGALTDQEETADRILKVNKTNYLSIMNTGGGQTSMPKVLFSAMYQDVWYVPGGRSYIAQILKYVNGTFAWADNDQVGSLQLSFENVAAQSLQNDVWIDPEVNSIDELLSRDHRYQNCVNNSSSGIFQQNARMNNAGGNDYWESGVVRADWVLQDFGKMIHPELFENATFTYFKQLK